MTILLQITRNAGRHCSNRCHHKFSSVRYGSVLSHPSIVDNASEGENRGRIVCITSGKGGVGKTTSAASFAFGLASVSFNRFRNDSFYVIDRCHLIYVH